MLLGNIAVRAGSARGVETNARQRTPDADTVFAAAGRRPRRNDGDPAQSATARADRDRARTPQTTRAPRGALVAAVGEAACAAAPPDMRARFN